MRLGMLAKLLILGMAMDPAAAGGRPKRCAGPADAPPPRI